MKIAFDELFFLSFLVRWMSRQCATVAEADLLFVAESENHFDSFSPSTHVSESKAHCLRNAKQQQREKKKLLVIISPRQSLETRAKKNNTRKQKKNWREKRAAPDSWNGKANQWCLSPYMCLTFRSEKAAWGRCGGDG